MADRIKRPWKIHAQNLPASTALARDVGVSPVVGQLLLNRHLATADAANRWLSVPFTDIPPPDAIPGTAVAGMELACAARDGAKVCVYGDYDVDGTTGASTISRVLRRMGADVTVYIPHRLEEGYGLNAAAVRKIAQSGHTHLVTVDCGIASVAEIALAHSLGLVVIVTDHHQPKSQLPENATLVHPGLPGITTGAPNMCGSAVAWTVARAAAKAYRDLVNDTDTHDDINELLRDSLALAAIGTVADVVPLVAENRSIVRHGLLRLSKSTDTGLLALLGVCDLKYGVQSEDVGFKIGPRINAAGRLGAAGRVIDLLRGNHSPDVALRLAEYLDQSNQLRQKIERTILAEAREQGSLQVDLGRSGLVVASENWHPGVIGIVASRLVERFGRPALIVSFGTRSGVGYGSGRSIPGLPLHEALQSCGEYLVSHGGHAMAAGFKVKPENLDALKSAFWSYCDARYGGPPPPPPLIVESEAKISQLSSGLVSDLFRLEPHGAANPRPFFLLRDCRVEVAKVIGKQQDHLSLTVSHPGPGNGNRIRCVGFGMGERIDEFKGFVDLIGVPKINEWMGRKSVEMELKDARPADRRAGG